MAVSANGGLYVNPTTGEPIYVSAGGEVPAGYQDVNTPTTSASYGTSGGYVAPKSTAVMPEYKVPSTNYTPEYYNALRDKYAADTTAQLTSPEMVQAAKASRAGMAGSGVLGGSGYTGVQKQRVNAVQGAGDLALSKAISDTRMAEETANRNALVDKTNAENTWAAGQAERDEASLATAKQQAQAEVNNLYNQLMQPWAEMTDPTLREKYNIARDRLEELSVGHDISNVDYTLDFIKTKRQAAAATEAQKMVDILGVNPLDWTEADMNKYDDLMGIVQGTGKTMKGSAKKAKSVAFTSTYKNPADVTAKPVISGLIGTGFNPFGNDDINYTGPNVDKIQTGVKNWADTNFKNLMTKPGVKEEVYRIVDTYAKGGNADATVQGMESLIKDYLQTIWDEGSGIL